MSHPDLPTVAAQRDAALSILQDLAAESWLDDDPCDTPELAKAKVRARAFLTGMPVGAATVDKLKALLQRWLTIDDWVDDLIAPADLIAETKAALG